MVSDDVRAESTAVVAIADVSKVPAGSFSAREIAYAAAKSDPERRLAARLAAKQAAVAALGGSLELADVEIVRGRGGPPRIELSERGRARLAAIGRRPRAGEPHPWARARRGGGAGAGRPAPVRRLRVALRVLLACPSSASPATSTSPTRRPAIPRPIPSTRTATRCGSSTGGSRRISPWRRWRRCCSRWTATGSPTRTPTSSPSTAPDAFPSTAASRCATSWPWRGGWRRG